MLLLLVYGIEHTSATGLGRQLTNQIPPKTQILLSSWTLSLLDFNYSGEKLGNRIYFSWVRARHISIHEHRGPTCVITRDTQIWCLLGCLGCQIWLISAIYKWGLFKGWRAVWIIRCLSWVFIIKGKRFKRFFTQHTDFRFSVALRVKYYVRVRFSRLSIPPFLLPSYSKRRFLFHYFPVSKWLQTRHFNLKFLSET